MASHVSEVEVLSGNGLGMIRRRYGPKSASWEETCGHYEEGRSYDFRIHTEAADYPYPITDLTGRWSLEPRQSGLVFSITIEARSKGNVAAYTLFSLAAKRQFKTVLIDLVDAWAKRMEQQPKA